MSEAAVMTHPADTVERDIPEIRFISPLPGLERLTRFALVRLDDAGLLFSLRSLEDDTVRLVVMAPSLCFPDYVPELDDATAAELGLESSADALTLVVVNAAESFAASTANLLAPVVVHARTGAAAQVLLSGSDYSVRAPLVAA